MSLRELQEVPIKLMKGFYDPMSFVRIALKTLAFPIDYLIRGWDIWYRSWRNDLRKYGGHLVIKRWAKCYKRDDFVGKLESVISYKDQAEIQ
jgi:hypothetical protein